MRSLLYKFEGINSLFDGVVTAVCNSPDKKTRIILFKDVRHKGLKITDHIWVKIPMYLAPRWVEVGTTVRFSGKVHKYFNRENKLNFGIHSAVLH